jgi:hypothetical protein
MTRYKFGHIILIGFPHTDLQSLSKRPVIILYIRGGIAAIGIKN